MAHYFLAVSIPDQLQLFYDAWQQKLKNNLPYKKWTASKDLHITLVFLGAVNETKMNHLIKQLKRIDLPKSFPLTIASLGFFGERKRPRVLYATIEPNQQLIRLQQRVSEIVQAEQLPVDRRPYHPHLTLAKQWQGDTELTDEMVRHLRTEYTNRNHMELSAFTLYKIHPNKSPSYEAIELFPLKK